MASSQRRQVVTEEEYQSTLSDIVERDYFPDLAVLRQKAAVLEKRAAKDFKGAVQVRRAGRQLLQHEESLAAQEEEEEQDLDCTSNTRRNPRPLHRENVTGFHARVTSEDNHEFHENMKEEVQVNQERLKQVFKNPYPAIVNERRNADNQPPLLASDQFNAPHHRIEAPKYTSKENGFFFTPHHDSKDSNLAERKLLTDRKADRELMPPPAPKKAASSTALVVKQDLVEYVPKHSLERRIEPSQTRFPTTVALVQPSHPPDDNSDGTTTDYSTEATTDLDASPRSINEDRKARARKIQKEQETLVAMTPLIVPGRAGEPGSPITTWGTVSDTPVVLGGMDVKPPSSYSIPVETSREKAARKAEAKLTERTKSTKPKRRKLNTPLPGRAANLTPAAKSLLRKSMLQSRPSSVRSSSSFSSSLRSSYTPQRHPSSSRNRGGGGGGGAAATPRLTVPKVNAKRGSGNITDGLLKIP